MIIPQEGFGHPDFQRLRADEAMEAVFCFAWPPAPDEQELLQKLLQWWTIKVPWDELGGKPEIFEEVQGAAWQIVLKNCPAPATPLRILWEKLRQTPLRLQETLLAVWMTTPQGGMAYKADTRWRYATYPTDAEKWRAAFDPSLSMPLPAPPMSPGEWAGAPLQVPGLRALYGIPPHARTISPSPYLQHLGKRIFRLTRRQMGTAIQFVDKYEDELLPDLIECQDRLGYLLTMPLEQFVVDYGKLYRLRLYEWLHNCREVSRQLYLAPVLHWERDDDMLRTCFWARWTYPQA